MRTINLLAVIILSIFTFQFSFGQNASFRTENIKVWGNCKMCKKKIQSAAKDAGATSSIWTAQTQTLQVNYSSTVTNRKKIQQAIAKAGYDTEDFTADQEAYDKLPECCKYERKAVADVKKDGTTKKSCCKHDEANANGKACCDEANSKTCCSKHDGAATNGKGCCEKHGAHDATVATCCDSKDCKHDATACKEADCCKDKQCCKS